MRRRPRTATRATPRRGPPDGAARRTRAAPAAVGIRVKSGWATAVLVLGPAAARRVADRRVIELSDRAVPESRQPYHAVLGARAGQGARVEHRLVRIVQDSTRRSINALLKDYRKSGHAVRAVGLVVGSVIDPLTIANDHIRAHALEGRLFRTALERAVRSFRLPCSVLVERDAYAKAATVLGRPAGALKRAVTELGRPLAGPWRADEKTAALAAWMALHNP